MLTGQPITEIIPRRFSCRTYQEQPIEAGKQRQLQAYLDTLHTGPLGSTMRFELAAATEDDRQSLRGLGTYGFIQRAAGFIVGAAQPGEKNLEDYGYLMEQAILAATDLGWGPVGWVVALLRAASPERSGPTARKLSRRSHQWDTSRMIRNRKMHASVALWQQITVTHGSVYSFKGNSAIH